MAAKPRDNLPMSEDGRDQTPEGSEEEEAQVVRLREELLNASPRSAAILCVAMLENVVRIAILRALPIADKVTKRIVGDGAKGGELSFVWQCRLAYSLKILGPITLADLDLLGQIRNMFAHREDKADFTDPEIAKLCSKLQTPELEQKVPGANFHAGPEAGAPDPASPRYRFECTFLEIWGGLFCEIDARRIRLGPWVLM